MRPTLFALCLLWVTAAAGCTSDDLFNDDDRRDVLCRTPEVERVDPRGQILEYAIDCIHFPKDSDEASSYAANVDGTGRHNALGFLLTLFSTRYDLDGAVRELVARGEIAHTLELRATSLHDSDGVGVTTSNGRADGLGHFAGRIRGGHLHAELGTFPLSVTFPGLGRVFVLPLVGVTLDADVTEAGLSGTLSGGVRKDGIDALIAAFHEGMSRIVADECQPTCAKGSLAKILVDAFDADHDGALSLGEVRDNALTQGLLWPDLDLYQGTTLMPGCDGGSGGDALSVGVAFTATRL
jgi:hypothetical protein